MNILKRILQEYRNGIYALHARFARTKESVDIDVPYVCQFARPEHAELSLKGELETRHDPHWRETGAASLERYVAWAFTMCGMASTAMALGYFKGAIHLPVHLAEDALAHGVYVDEDGILSAMKYREFATWIKKYGIHASIYTRLSMHGIQYALSAGGLVIISVNPNIRGYNTAPVTQKGGHLVLVTGYNRAEKVFYIYNPSGFTSTNTQVRHALSHAEFQKYYVGRGIVLDKNC